MPNGPGPGETAGPPREEEELWSRLLDLEFQNRKSPKNLDLLREILEIYEQLGDEKEASALRRRIAEIDPEDPSLRGKEIAPPKVARIEPREPVVPIGRDLPRILRYPLAGRGAMMLAGGVVYIAAGRWFAGWLLKYFQVPIINLIFACLVWIIVWGTIWAFWFRVAETSANGEDEPPDWAEFGTFLDSMVSPLFAAVACIVLTLGPFLFLLALCQWLFEYNFVTLAVLALLLLIGIYHAPMVFLVLSRYRRVQAIGSLGLIRSSIGKVRADYGRLVVAILTAILISVGVAAFFGLAFTLPLLGPIIYYVATSLVWLYLGTISFHLIGRLYYHHAERLAWFDEWVEPSSS